MTTTYPNPDTTTTICMLDDLTDVYFRQELAIIPTTIILSLSVLTYGLRIIARLLTKQRIWWDDALMGVGLLLSFEPAICQYLRKPPPPFFFWPASKIPLRYATSEYHI